MKITTEDKKWREKVYVKYGKFCSYCNSTCNLNCHHIFSRRIKSIRHYVPNGIILCAKHHIFSIEFSAHQTPTSFTLWVIKKRGKKWYNDLERKKNE